MSVYFNDSEPFVCAWLENLIREKLLPAGVVDRRPIQEVEPSDVRDFTQCHFFAGIGGWAYALQLAGWGDRPIWTGSCPCQPFSTAGKQKAHHDKRHLWPEWFRLIRQCRPERVFGEQVASGVGLGWLDVVSTDLEAEAYTVGAVVLGAHSVGAPHIRQRLWFVADSQCDGQRSRGTERTGLQRGAASDDASPTRLVADAADADGGAGERGAQTGARTNGERRGRPTSNGATGELADAEGGDRSLSVSERGSQQDRVESRGRGETGELGNPSGSGLQGRKLDATEQGDGGRVVSGSDGAARHPWDCDWLPCRDGKARPIPTEPRLFPLVDAGAVRNRVALLRGSGNAIVPQVAAAFVKAYMEVSA